MHELLVCFCFVFFAKMLCTDREEELYNAPCWSKEYSEFWWIETNVISMLNNEDGFIRMELLCVLIWDVKYCNLKYMIIALLISLVSVSENI